MLHHQLSTTSTIDTTFSLQDELLMSGDFGILNSNKSRRSSDCKFTQTVFEQEDHETFEEVLEHDLGEDESPFKKAKRMGPTYAAVVVGRRRRTPLTETNGEEPEEVIEETIEKEEVEETMNTAAADSRSNYKDIFKEIFMVLARANTNENL